MLKATRLLAVSLLSLLQGCTQESAIDVSKDPKFQARIGEEYEVIGALDAYGIRTHSGSQVQYITLIPPPGIEGPEIGYMTPVAAGSRIRILAILRTNRLFDPRMTLLVHLEGTLLPIETPIRIEMYRGNQGSDPNDLNPAVFRRVE